MRPTMSTSQFYIDYIDKFPRLDSEGCQDHPGLDRSLGIATRNTQTSAETVNIEGNWPEQS